MGCVCDKVVKRRRKTEKGAKTHHMLGEVAVRDSCLVR